MGQQAQKPVTAIERRKAVIKDTLVRIDKQRASLEAVLDGVVPVDRFLEVAKTAYLTNPQPLSDCTPKSVVRSIAQIALLQLSPDPRVGDAYLIPRRNKDTREMECTVMTGYQGLLKRIRRHPDITAVNASVVYAGDTFEYEEGLTPRLVHKPAIKDRGNVIATYAIAFRKDAPPTFRVCTLDEIHDARARSESWKRGQQGPWKTDFAAMAMKTAIRRLAKLLPLDDTWRGQISAEEEIEAQAVEASRTRALGPSLLEEAIAEAAAAADQPAEEPDEGTDDIGREAVEDDVIDVEADIAKSAARADAEATQ